MFTDLQMLIVFVGMFTFMLPGSLVFLAISVRKIFNVTVTQPPITVQAPTALIPDYVTEVLRRIDEKMAPPTTPADDAMLGTLVVQAVQLAAQAKGKTGPDRFRTARDFVLQRAREANLSIDDRALALRIEAEYVTQSLARKG